MHKHTKQQYSFYQERMQTRVTIKTITFFFNSLSQQARWKRGKIRFINQILQKQFTSPFHTRIKSRSKKFVWYFFKSLDTSNKRLAELVSIIITHADVCYFFLHGIHGNSPETLGLLLCCNILQYRGKLKKKFFPLLFEMISHAFHGSWQCSKTFLINLTLEVVRIDFLLQNFYDSIHLISVIHKSFYCFLFVLFPFFSCKLVFLFLRSVEFSPIFKALLKQLYNSIFRKTESAKSF